MILKYHLLLFVNIHIVNSFIYSQIILLNYSNISYLLMNCFHFIIMMLLVMSLIIPMELLSIYLIIICIICSRILKTNLIFTLIFISIYQIPTHIFNSSISTTYLYSLYFFSLKIDYLIDINLKNNQFYQSIALK
jgi:hypothetical protein